MKYQKQAEAESQLSFFQKKKSEMTDAERVSMFTGKLYQKAKQDGKYQFYVLYDKMFLPFMLREAWKQVKRQSGSPGIDGLSIQQIEKQGVDAYLSELAEDLRRQTYRPKAVKRVMIPKADGGERPLGIPTVRDRIAQTVCKMILDPIYEADFAESSYGFRPDRGARDAIKAIKGHLEDGKVEVLDADLSKYFDTIPHDKLIKTLQERIADPRLLKLIGKWLKAPVYEDGQFKGGKKNKAGTPQGGVISPLLANIYLNLLDRTVNRMQGLFQRAGIALVRYADDFVLMAGQIPTQIEEKLNELISRMGLELNTTKTRKVNASQTSFDFLGFTMRYDKDLSGRSRRYWNISPSKKSEKKLRVNIDGYLKAHGHYRTEIITSELNVKLRGWFNYFDIPRVSYPAMSKRRVRHYLSARLMRYYNRKSQRKSRLYRQDAFKVMVEKYNLIDPTKYSVSVLTVKA